MREGGLQVDDNLQFLLKSKRGKPLERPAKVQSCANRLIPSSTFSRFLFAESFRKWPDSQQHLTVEDKKNSETQHDFPKVVDLESIACIMSSVLHKSP